MILCYEIIINKLLIIKILKGVSIDKYEIMTLL
jgi:hypothetical protein